MAVNIDTVKAALRITGTDPGLDGEIEQLVKAAESDLKTSGINNTTDPLYMQAVTIYVKAEFGFDNPDRKGFLESYEMMKMKMMGTEEFR